MDKSTDGTRGQARWKRAIAGAILVSVAAITIVAYATSYYGWPHGLELLSHFQAQYWAIVAIMLVLACLLRQKWPIYATLLCFAVLSVQILPWLPPPMRAIAETQSTADVRIFVANIRQPNSNYERVRDLLRSQQPDVAVLMEIDAEWDAEIEKLSDLFSYSSSREFGYNPGLTVYSREPLSNVRLDFFGGSERSSIVGELTIADRRVTLVATHPKPPVPLRRFHARNSQLDRVGQYVATVDRPVILVGDLNTTMWSPYYRRLVGRTGLRNARAGFGLVPTWPMPGTYFGWLGQFSRLLMIPIDHCLHSPELETVAIAAGEPTGSDHLPIVVDLKMSPVSD